MVNVTGILIEMFKGFKWSYKCDNLSADDQGVKIQSPGAL